VHVATYNELWRQRCFERICEFLRILTDTALSRPYCPESLGKALLSAMSVRRARQGAVHAPEPGLFSRLPPIRGHRTAVGLRCMAGTGGPRRAEAVDVVFLGRGEQIGLESGKLEGSVGTRVPRQRRRHGDFGWEVVGRS
jgi:hypothetical protein